MTDAIQIVLHKLFFFLKSPKNFCQELSECNFAEHHKVLQTSDKLHFTEL